MARPTNTSQNKIDPGNAPAKDCIINLFLLALYLRYQTEKKKEAKSVANT